MLSEPERETELLRRVYASAVQAAAAETCLAPALAALPARRPALVLGAGKAAAAMAAAFCAHWGESVRGMVVTRYGHGLKPGERADGVEIVEAGHPSPDAESLAAGARLLELASSLRRGEGLYCLISGGGSALAAAPLPGIGLEQKRRAAAYLMRRGAGIHEINCVRKHLSALKGGRLAEAAHPAAVTTFLISDVPGDDIADIASGPTVPDPTTQADALAILERFGYPRIGELQAVLGNPAFESPKPADPAFAGDRVHLIASARTALDAAARVLEAEGYRVVQLGDDLTEEASALGRAHARLAKKCLAAGTRTALVSGGETHVVLGDGAGRGGRNLEYLAGLAAELDASPGIFALAADTDGIDGHGDHAGAIVTPQTPVRGGAGGFSISEALATHDTYRFFDACGALLRTGPTRTNVNDFRLIVCEP